MNFEDNGAYEPGLLDEDTLLVTDTDASKWAAVHDDLDPTAPRIAASSGAGSLFTIAWVLGIALGLIWVIRNGRTVFDQWQENVHRRANRRRHGIPDHDDRPFNVAYAAAAMARRQREEAEKKKLANTRREPSRPDSGWARHESSTGLRQRSTQSEGPSRGPFEKEEERPMFIQGTSMKPPVNSATQYGSGKTSTHRAQFRPQPHTDPRAVEAYDWSDRYNPRPYADSRQNSRSNAPQFAARSSSVDAGNHRRLNIDAQDHAPAERRKHHQLDDTDDEDRTTKKSRVDGDELIDGDNDAGWENMPGGSRRGSLQVLKRGSKRQANLEEDDWEMSQDKRARKGSGTHGDVENVVDVEMARDSSDAEVEPARGTKREREEADSVVDVSVDDTDESRPHPARKRRAGKRGEPEFKEPLSRGRKRVRSSERSTTSDEDGEESDVHPMLPKRSRRYVDSQEEDSDIILADGSESEQEIAHDPACGGRRLGETWQVNGQSFKVGLDGRRLRHALMRQSRSKFPMPKDSAHNDAKTNVDVIVEKWLNDDEYKAAKDNYELAWQDPSPVSTPDKAIVSAKLEEAPPSSGKRLLWAGPPPSPIKGRASMGGRTTASVQNPFDLAPSNAGRRVASVHLLMNSPVESPKLRSAKSFSKWEKQDLEASSLKKMRAKLQKQKAEEAAAAAAAAPAPTPLTPSTNTQAPPAPSIQFNPDTKASAVMAPSAAPKPSSVNPFAKPASSTPSAPTPSITFAKSDITPSSTAPPQQPSASSLMLPPAQTSTASPASAAPPASKPLFTFTPSSSTAPTPSAPSKTTAPKALFSFPAQLGPASSSPISAPSGAAKPPLKFGPTPSEPNKSQFNFGPSSRATHSSDPNFFTKPASQPTPAPIPTSAPASNSPFAFNSTQPAQSIPSRTPSFQFNGGGQSNPPASSGNGASSGSLLNRLGPGSGFSPAPQLVAPQDSWSAPLGPPSSAFNNNATTSQPSSSTNPFSQNQPQSQPANKRSLSDPFGSPQSQNASAQSSSSSPFGPPSSQGQTQSTNKSMLIGPGTSSQAEASKNAFGQPSSTPGASAFPFSKPSGQADTQSKPGSASFTVATPAAQPDSSASQSKSPFAFNFSGSGTPGNANAGAFGASPSPNPFGQSTTPSTGAQPKPGAFGFNFGTSTGGPSIPNPFGFGSKPADGEKK